MITASYDAVAGELTIDAGDGKPPLSIPVPVLHAKFYASGGAVSCLFGVDVVDVLFLEVKEDPGRMVIDELGTNHWRVRFEFVHPDDPSPRPR